MANVDLLLTAASGLTIELDQLWRRYVGLEAAGRRREAMDSLKLFIAEITPLSGMQCESFAGRVAAALAANRSAQFAVREPLFAAVIAPLLVRMWDSHDPRAARWLLAFDGSYRYRPASLAVWGDRDITPESIIARGLEHEPDARDLHARWVSLLAADFQYAVHEVPAGVLAGNRVATIEQCEEYLRDLAEFERRVELLGERERWQTKVEWWRRCFAGYRSYLQQRERWENFGAYLAHH